MEEKLSVKRAARADQPRSLTPAPDRPEAAAKPRRGLVLRHKPRTRLSCPFVEHTRHGWSSTRGFGEKNARRFSRQIGGDAAAVVVTSGKQFVPRPFFGLMR
ncbi:hypothetical protein MTO96_015551 [Rhipicephalus appendiculatus]